MAKATPAATEPEAPAAGEVENVTDGALRIAGSDVEIVEPAVDEPAKAGKNPVVSDCVVNKGRGYHVGRAVNGKVCSYHAMAYKSDGSPR